jgi:glutamate:Na+ symporter, ESS family
LIPTVKLDAIQVLAISCFGVVIGVWLKKQLRLLDRLNVPAPIAGGLVYAVVTLVLRDRIVNLDMDLTLQRILMIGFFTTIGMSASLQLIRSGGPQVLKFFGIATAGAVLQNILGIGVAKALGIEPLLGLVAGSVALTGGPATALAFGKTFEDMGVAGATTMGVASAMFGITAGGLLGGYIGGWLIRRHRLLPASGSEPRGLADAEAIAHAGDLPVAAAVMADPMADESQSERSALLLNVIAIAIAMGLGTLISAGIEGLGLTLPAYVGAMIAAAVVRNVDDVFGFVGISQRMVDDIGNVALYIFIVMALLTLRLWELVNLALPLLVLLVAQVVLVWFLCIWLSYYLMGRDYQSAVMSGGYCGFMLGTTANAMACMDVLTEKYGPAPRAYIVVPLVGAFLIDFTNALVITNTTDLLRYLLN